MFPYPFRVSRLSNLRFLSRKLEQLDIVGNATKARPNTKWEAFLLTNIRYSVTLLDYVLGLGEVILPQYIKRSKAIQGLDKNAKTGKRYKYNLCLFRCYALHCGKNVTRLEIPTKFYFKKWKKHMQISESIKTFKGVKLEKISSFERLFKVNVNICALNEDKIASPVDKSVCKFLKNGQNNTMNLNIYQGHLSYITNHKLYSKKYECRSCEKLFKTKFECVRHEKICKKSTFYRFPGGYFKRNMNIFEELSGYNVNVDKDKQFYPYFITFDLESILQHIEESNPQHSKLKLKNKHIPISVSIASNVPDYTEPKCIVNKNMDLLISEMIAYMTEIQSHASIIMKEKFSSQINNLKKLREEYFVRKENKEKAAENDINSSNEVSESVENEPPSKQLLQAMTTRNTFQNFLQRLEKHDWDVGYNNWEENTPNESLDEIFEDEASIQHDEKEAEEYRRIKSMMHEQIVVLSKSFNIYCEQIPVLGFNSAKYDINLIRSKLIKYIDLTDQKFGFTI